MMSDRKGGKKKHLKQPKKDIKELDEAELDFIKKQKENQKNLKIMTEVAKTKKGLLSGGMKKSK